MKTILSLALAIVVFAIAPVQLQKQAAANGTGTGGYTTITFKIMNALPGEKYSGVARSTSGNVISMNPGKGNTPIFLGGGGPMQQSEEFDIWFCAVSPVGTNKGLQGIYTIKPDRDNYFEVNVNNDCTNN